jgi:hypothetical protein
MTSTSAAASISRTNRTTMLAGLGVALSAITIVVGNYNVPDGENGGVSQGISTGVFSAIVAAVLFGLVVPRIRKADRATLILGIVTVLSIAVFWSGLTPILAAATVAAADRTEVASRRTTVMRWMAIAVAVLTVVFTVATGHLF